MTSIVAVVAPDNHQEDAVVKLRTYLVAALLIAAPASTALAAAPGLLRTAATMRAGPGPGFPAVERIPAGARVTVHGCIDGGAWCDVSSARERGWVAARTLAYLYGERYVYVPDYVEVVPVVPFTLTTYWSSFYIGRPWFHRHAFWHRYWQRHPPVVAHHSPRPGMIGGAPGGVAHGVGGGGMAGGPAMPPRMATGAIPAPVAGPAGPRMPTTPAPMAAAPARAPAQVMPARTVGLVGVPQSARAQMGGMRVTAGSSAPLGMAHFGGGPAMGGSRMAVGAPRGGGGRVGGFRRH
ncbi:SH3 domain-containing protein [Bradyrhizobium sp. HKCCYLRH3099]|uniref:SH3 domain-containing protein n=1 Tax=unclassified Bradyrhizobium TaxID=2631580 RepID=UPI003EC0EBAA